VELASQTGGSLCMYISPGEMAICSRTPNSPVGLAVWVLHACKTRTKEPPNGKCFKTTPSGEIVCKTTPNGEIVYKTTPNGEICHEC